MRALFRFFSLVLLLALPVSAAFAASAYVHDLAGTLSARVGPGPAIPLKIGDTFDPGVTLVTGANGTAVVKFEDGQVVTLSPNTQFAVREYNYNKRSVRESNVVFALLRGGLRFVTGVIGATNRNAFKLNVGTATIGVRGTDGWVSFINDAIVAAVNQGALDYATPAGSALIPAGSVAVSVATPGTGVVTRAPVVAPSNQIASAVSRVTTVQTATTVQTSLNAAIQAAGAAIPLNTPTIVAVAAQAAVALATARAAQALAAAAPDNATAQQAARDAQALAARALAAAQEAAIRAVSTATQGGATLPAAPASTPQAVPLSQPTTPSLTPQEAQAQADALQASVNSQSTSLTTTQQTLGLTGTVPQTLQGAQQPLQNPVPPPPVSP